MVASAATGDLLDCGEGSFSLAEMQAWAKQRTVRAAVLRHLLVASQWPVHAKGVRMRGLRISRHLDLEAATLRCPLVLDCCYLDAEEPACLDHATASRITLTRCQLAGLTGEMLTARELDLSGSTLTGPVGLTGADIAGQFSRGGAQLAGAGRGGIALAAAGMKAGWVFLDEGFTAAGAVRLAGADIAGQLNCGGAQLTGTDRGGNALAAAALKAGWVFLDEGFTAAGAVRLTGAAIAGHLSCRGAQLTGTDRDGNALTADRLKVGGGVFLNEGFTAAGAVRLVGADIAGQLNCGGAQLTGAGRGGNGQAADAVNADRDVFLDEGFTTADAVRLTGAGGRGRALAADGLKVGSHVFLTKGFTATGTVSLNSARIGGSVDLRPAALASEGKVALEAAWAQISGTLRWAPAAQVWGQVNLEGASTGHLEDDWSSGREYGCWPTGGRLRLDGFTYDRVGGGQQATVEQRLEWIRSQYQSSAGESPTAFTTQPYEQLAAVYRQAGQDTQARKVAIARRADLRRFGNLSPYRKAGNWLLDKTIKYGYQAWRAAAGLVVLYLAFWVLAVLAQHDHVIVPVGDIDGLHAVPAATRCTTDYPCFYPAGYSVNTVIPIINVHQAQYWGPDGHAPWGWAWVTGTWIATGLGWALATLLVAGYTGLVRHD